jgi:peptide/nickel transport system substrate-binding protein
MIRKRKLFPLVVCLMVVGLMASLISGCGTSNGGNGGNGNGNGDDTPQYGGEFIYATTADPTYFDDAVGPHAYVTGPYQCLWGGDWAKGIAGGYGTAECDWFVRGELNRLEHKTGKIAESWTIGDDYIEFYLRDGVKWHDKFPTNGRDVTADDVVFSWERQITEDTYFKTGYPHLASSLSVSKVDESTVRFECPAEYMAELISLIEYVYIVPQDAIELYGDMSNWENIIGTGAFTLEEYLPGSYLYYERSDVYWQTNPVGPGQGDQLPYLDSITVQIQADISTHDSLFRTGQIDMVTADFDRAQELLTIPDVESNKFLDATLRHVIYMRTDKEDKPYGDVRVRQALMLAIDNQEIIDQYFGGEAEALYWPVYECKEYADAHVPLEDLEDDMIEVQTDPPTEISVADLFGYDPELAQELLAEAGYPDGFKVEIIYSTAVYIWEDLMQLVQGMWEDIGLDVTLKPVDSATHTTTQYLRNYDDMFFGAYSGVGTYFKGINWQGTGMFNASYVDDPVLNDYRDQMLAAFPVDEDEAFSIHTEMLPYLLEQCYVIQVASHYTWRFWWPWLKNYSGEGAVGYYGGASSYTPYIWIDQDLKEDMGY